MSTHYFFTPNMNRPYRSLGLSLRFEPLAIEGGVWSGTAATEVEAEVKAFRELVKDTKNNGVRELTEDEFTDLTKKKAPSLPPSPPSQTPSLQHPAARIEQSPAVVVEGGKSDPVVEKTPIVENVEDVIKVAKVKPSETAEAKKKKKFKW